MILADTQSVTHLSRDRSNESMKTATRRMGFRYNIKILYRRKRKQ